jgi:hypothetical protein
MSGAGYDAVIDVDDDNVSLGSQLHEKTCVVGACVRLTV